MRAEWGELQPGVSIGDGVLRMDLTKSDTWIGGPIQGRDAAIQFKFTPLETSKDAMVQLFLRLTEDGSFYAVAFQVQNGTWRVEKHYGASGDVSLMAEGQSEEMGINQATKVLAIAQGDQISVFMNDQPLAYLEDDEFKGDWNSININSWDGHTVVDFHQQLRFWRLTSFDEFTLILDAIADVPPHLASDFSSAAGGVYTWNCTDIIQCEIADGVMRLNVDQEFGIDLLGDPLNATDFVLEIEVHPTEIATDSALSFRFASSQAGFYSFGIGFAMGNWGFNKYWFQENKSEIFAEGTTNPVLQGSWARFRFIAYNDQYAVYLNDAPLFCFRDSTFNGDENGFGLHSGQGLMVIEFDNAKLWDLSKVGNLP